MRCLRFIPLLVLSTGILVSVAAGAVAQKSAATPKSAATNRPVPAPAAKALPVTEVTAATVGKPYSYPIHLAIGSLTATNPFTLAVGSGALPACLQMTTDGVLSGTPDAKCVGTYRFVVYITSNNGEQSSGTYLLHVNAASAGDKTESTASAGDKSESTADSDADRPAAANSEPQPECGLVITSVLSDGATLIKGNVNKDVVDENSQIAFCRSRTDQPRACVLGHGTRVDQTLFEPLAGDAGYYVTPSLKSGTFSGTLLVPLDYGDSVKAVLVTYSKQCVEKPFGVEAAKAADNAVAPQAKTGKNTQPKPTAQTPPKNARKPASQLQPKSQATTTRLQEARESITPPGQTSPVPQQAGEQGDPTPPRALLASAPVTVRAFSQPGAAAHARAVSEAVGSPQQVPATLPKQSPDASADTYSPELPASPNVGVSEPQENGKVVHPPGEEPIFAPSSPTVAVEPGPDWGRIRATFVLGILLANDSSQLSSAHQFYDFLVEKYWSLPGCYRSGSEPGKCMDDQDTPVAKGWLKHHYPGVNTYFETRLTAIPISSNPSPSTASGTTTSTTGSSKDATTTTTTSSGNFLTTQKTARVAVGADLPFLITRWEWRRKPNALFIAPLGKTGFDTLTGSSSQTIVGPDGGSTTASYERLYNYYAFGGRIGHYTLSHSQNSAPEWQSFLDVVIGRFSNLQSYICEPATRKPATFIALSGTQCANAYGGAATEYVDSLKRPYRLDFEGALKVPYVPLLMGFNANLGQHAISTGHIDPAFNTPDDLRFLFGTKFDVASFLNKLGLPGLGK